MPQTGWCQVRVAFRCRCSGSSSLGLALFQVGRPAGRRFVPFQVYFQVCCPVARFPSPCESGRESGTESYVFFCFRIWQNLNCRKADIKLCQCSQNQKRCLDRLSISSVGWLAAWTSRHRRVHPCTRRKLWSTCARLGSHSPPSNRSSKMATASRTASTELGKGQ